MSVSAGVSVESGAKAMTRLLFAFALTFAHSTAQTGTTPSRYEAIDLSDRLHNEHVIGFNDLGDLLTPTRLLLNNGDSEDVIVPPATHVNNNREILSDGCTVQQNAAIKWNTPVDQTVYESWRPSRLVGCTPAPAGFNDAGVIAGYGHWYNSSAGGFSQLGRILVRNGAFRLQLDNFGSEASRWVGIADDGKLVRSRSRSGYPPELIFYGDLGNNIFQLGNSVAWTFLGGSYLTVPAIATSDSVLVQDSRVRFQSARVLPFAQPPSPLSRELRNSSGAEYPLVASSAANGIAVGYDCDVVDGDDRCFRDFRA